MDLKFTAKKPQMVFNRNAVYVYCPDKEELGVQLNELNKKYPNDIWVLIGEKIDNIS